MSKVDASKVIRMLERKDKKLIRNLEKAMTNGIGFFESYLLKKQMNGRPGLKTQTGTLKKSWWHKVKGHGITFSVTLGTGTKYARIHQYGGTIKPKPGNELLHFRIGQKWIKKKEVKIPKRLHVIEAFNNRGKRIIRRGMKDVLREFCS